MKVKKLLTAVLLVVGLCFVSGVGHGEIWSSLHKPEGESMEFWLLRARVDYMMTNPTRFLDVDFVYDVEGAWEADFPEGVVTEGKIVIVIYDNRDRFTDKSGLVLLGEFKHILEVLYSYIEELATDMNTDIVSKLSTEEEIPLTCFYQGVYQLWGERVLYLSN